MALYHFWQVLVTMVFGGFTWALCRYLMLVVGNMFATNFPEYATLPHVSFMLAVTNWGLWLLVMLPVAFYLWQQTQRPEVD